MGNAMHKRTIQNDGPVTLFQTPAGTGQVYITASLGTGAGGPAAESARAYRAIAEALAAQGLTIVHERIFGSLDAQPEVLPARDQALRSSGIDPQSAITYIEGCPLWGQGLSGVHIHAIGPDRDEESPRTLFDDGQPCGRTWKRHGATFLLLQNLHGLEAEADTAPHARQRQAERLFARAERILRANGASYRDVVRTWIYLCGLLDWYDEFNTARSLRYGQFGILPNQPGDPLALPASTGIEGNNPLGAAAAMDLLAIVGEEGVRPAVEQLSNARQKDAFQYGSAFSRAASIQKRDVRQILISGTAAIDEAGVSLYVDDTRKQIIRTFENVQALIGPHGGTLQDICDANIFLKHAEDAAVFRETMDELGLTGLPAVCVNVDVCRDDLLFEIDGVAVVPHD